MDLRKIKKLIDLLEESNLAELEIKEGEEIVRLSRYPKGMAPMPFTPSPTVLESAKTPVALPRCHREDSIPGGEGAPTSGKR